MPGKLVVVVGGQFGSEAKGAVAAHLTRTEPHRMMAIRVAGPNAGHTVFDDQGQEFKLRCIPVAAAVDHEAILAIAAGSEVDEAVLEHEIEELEAAGHPVRTRLLIDSQATVLGTQHIQQEINQVLDGRIGSTAKGIGAARADRIWRSAEVWGEDHNLLGEVDVADRARRWLRQGGTVLIEGTQGYGLGLHAGYYPHCTSSDCRAIDFLAMAGLSPWDEAVKDFEVWVTFRTYPIRVAGNSGPLLGETTWEALVFDEERTTVTNKVRRVGQWDTDLALRAIAANGGHNDHLRIALMFMDYVVPGCAGKTFLDAETRAAVAEFTRKLGHKAPSLIGTGPQSIIDLRELEYAVIQ